MKTSRDNIVRIVIVLLLNSAVPLVWLFAGFGDHGQSAAVVYGSLIVTAGFVVCAIAALLRNKKTLSLVFGLAVPAALFAYVAFFSVLGAFLRLNN